MKPPGTRRLATMLGLVAVVSVAATGCTADELWRFGWPAGVTPQADEMRMLWTGSVIAALVVGLITWVLILWPVVFHRKRSEELPRQTQYNHILEFVYTGIPIIIVAVLFYFTMAAQNKVLDKTAKPDVTINVIGFQWNWEFDYLDYKTSDGEPVKTVGNSREIPLLVVPVGKTIHYNLTARDVIHSFYVPEMNFKRDVFPHPDRNNQDSSFQNTIIRPGSFVGRCAELCGTYHSAMNFEVRALPPELFDQYIKLRTQNNPQTNARYTAAEALTQLNCGELCTPHAVTTSPFNTDRTVRTASG